VLTLRVNGCGIQLAGRFATLGERGRRLQDANRVSALRLGDGQIFQRFPQGIADIHSFCTAQPGFSLAALQAKAHSV